MTDWFQFLRDLILRYIGLHLMDNFSFEDSSVLFTNIWPPGGFLFVLYLFAFITNGTNLYQVIHNWLNLFYHWIDFFSPSGMRNMFAYFGCCILRMVLTANKFMYSKPLSIEKFLFAYRTFYFFGFISDIFWKLNFYALSPMCNFFDKAKKTESLLAFRHHYSFTWRRTFRNVHTLQKPIEKKLILTSLHVTFVSYKRLSII